MIPSYQVLKERQQSYAAFINQKLQLQTKSKCNYIFNKSTRYFDSKLPYMFRNNFHMFISIQKLSNNILLNGSQKQLAKKSTNHINFRMLVKTLFSILPTDIFSPGISFIRMNTVYVYIQTGQSINHNQIDLLCNNLFNLIRVLHRFLKKKLIIICIYT